MAGRHALEITSASLAFSPWWASSRSGFVPQFKMFLRVAFLTGLGVPFDLMPQLVPDESNKVGEDTLFETS